MTFMELGYKCLLIMLTHEEEIKLKLFECIAANTQNLCDKGKYMDPDCVANAVKRVYQNLFSLNED